MNGTNLFFSPSGISSSSRSKRRCSSTDHTILNVSDLGPRERFGLSFWVCISFPTPLAVGGALRGCDGGDRGAFREERLSAIGLPRGRHEVGVDGSGISGMCDGLGESTSMKVEPTNVLSARDVVLQTSRRAGKRRKPDPTGQRCGVTGE